MRRIRIISILVVFLLSLAPQAAFSDVEKTVLEGTTVTVNAAESFDLSDVTEILWVQNPPDVRSIRLSDPNAAIATFVTPIVTQNTAFQLILWVTYKDGNKDSDLWTITVQDNGITQYPSNALPFFTANGHTMAIRVDPFGNEDGLVYLAPVDPASITNNKDRPDLMIYGLIEIRIKTDKPGRTTVANIYLERAALNRLKWCKYIRGEWKFGPDYTFIDLNRINVSIILQDGGDGDDDGVANGMIVDPSGLGSPPVIESVDRDLGSGNCFLNSLPGK